MITDSEITEVGEDDDGKEDDSLSDKVDDVWSDLEFTVNGILKDDEIPNVEKFSDNPREYPNQRRVMGDRVFYNVNTRGGIETTSLESIDNAKFYDPRFDILGDDIELVIKSYPKTGKDDDYELFINKGFVDKTQFEDDTEDDNTTEDSDDTETEKRNNKDTDSREQDNDDPISNDGKTDEGNNNNKTNDVAFSNGYSINSMKKEAGFIQPKEFSHQDRTNKKDDNENDGKNEVEEESSESTETDRKEDDKMTTPTNDDEQTETDEEGTPRAIIRDYEEKVLIEGNEIYGKYVVEENGDEDISFDAWENVVLFSEEDEFKTTGEYLDFHRETFKKDGEEHYKDYIKTIGGVKFNSKNEITGKSEWAVVNRDSSLPREDVDLYEDAQIRRYEYDKVEQLEDILTLNGGHIYMNGVDNYLVSTEDALLTSEKENLTINADRIEYYEQVDRAFARGDVLTTLNDNIFTSNYLYYNGVKKQILLKGKVRYILGTSVDGTADEILFDMETEEIISEGGSADFES